MNVLTPALRPLVLLVLCLSGVGCSTLDLQRPDATVTGMSLGEIDSSGFTMNFDVDLTNPNSIALPLNAADYSLGLAGVKIASGKAKNEGAIPAGGSKSISVPVALSYDDLLAAKDAIIQSRGNVPYALSGGVSVDTGMPIVGAMRVPLNYTGTLALKDILNDPQALLESKAARALAAELMKQIFSR